MKSIKTLVALAVASGAMMVAVDAQAQEKHGYRGSHSHGGWRGGHDWRGGHHWRGGGHHWRGHHWHGGSRWGWYVGVPLAIGAAWSWPYYHDYYHGPRVVYREVIREPEVIERIREVPAPQISPVPGPATEGVPAQGPLYMNYCASAKAYFPKVTSCPEGWKFISPTQ